MDSAPYRDLSAEECLALLRPGGIGRVGVSLSALPAIFPIRYAMLDEDIVFRVAFEGRLHAALSDAIVAFEADAVDLARTPTWSVLVVGRSQAITDHDGLDEAARLPLAAWAGDHHDWFARISCERISGRAYHDAQLFAAEGSPPERSA